MFGICEHEHEMILNAAPFSLLDFFAKNEQKKSVSTAASHRTIQSWNRMNDVHQVNNIKKLTKKKL